MEKSLEILKKLLITVLTKDPKFNINSVDANFWEKFLIAILKYESNKTLATQVIFDLNLDKPERIIEKLKNIYDELLNELAEMHTLNIQDESIEILINDNNETFSKKVSFFKTLENVVKKMERENLKKELPTSYDRLTFELDENEVVSVIKKTVREDLKKKFATWDNEEASVEDSTDEKTDFTITPNQNKVFSGWYKYAVAACVVFSVSLWYFNQEPTNIIKDENNVVKSETDSSLIKKPSVVSEENSAIVYKDFNVEKKVLFPTTMGFSSTESNINISLTIKDASEQINLLESQIANKTDRENEAIKNQIRLLKSQIGKYEFDEKNVIIYGTRSYAESSILSENNKEFYVKIKNQFYHLYSTEKPSDFEKVKDTILIEQLNKISFENED